MYNCPNPLNTSLNIVDLLEYLWLDKLWFRKNFDNILEKVMIVLWTIWNHRNNVVFKYDKCNPAYDLELARNMFYETTTHKNCANI